MFNFIKKLPIVPLEGRNKLVHLELLSLVYKESSIVPISCEIQENDDRDYLTQRYVDQMQHLIIEVKGEIVFPLIGLFDCGMFALNYRKFYS